jgi:hypothetical protein
MKPFVSVLALCLLLGACATRTSQQDRVPLPAAPPPGEPPSTEGMSAASLKLAFGAPAFTRKDGGTELWRYDGASCRAFFFLYPEANGLVVRHVETSPRPVDAAADQACLNTLRHKMAPPVS